MKKFVALLTLLLAALLAAPAAAQETWTGDWHGTLVTPRGQLRMLLTIRSKTEAARALALWVGQELDISLKHPDPAARAAADDLVALLTPIVKAALTDLGFEAANLGMQVWGGHGYIRDNGMEQFSRDARITILTHKHNRGVGGATLTGYEAALDDDADIVVKIDGDGQMDPALIPRFVRPIATGDADLLWSPEREAAEKPEGKKIAESCLLHLRGENGENYRFELKPGSQPACIGRAAGNRVRIEDNSISRVHCSLAMRSDGQVVLADLDSSNGTALNGLPLNPNEARPIQAGDRIEVGDLTLTVAELK